MTLVISKELGATFPRRAWGVISTEAGDPSTERLELIFPEDQDIIAADVADHLKEGVDIIGSLPHPERLTDPKKDLSWKATRLVLESTEVHGSVSTALYIDPEVAQPQQQIAA